jgi:hypothetical protein
MRSPVLKPVILMDLPVFHRAGWRRSPWCAPRGAGTRTILLHIDNAAACQHALLQCKYGVQQ